MLEEAKQVCPTVTLRLVREGALLVDVRERNEVAALAFNVPAIINIPLFELEQRWAELPKDRDIVVVCENGARSLKATYYLQLQGLARVSHMDGGILKWMSKSFPVVGQRHQASAVSTGCCGGAAGDNDENASCCASAVSTAATDCCGSNSDAATTCASCC